MNWNTLILTVGFALLSWGAKEVYSEVKKSHDDVLIIKTDMVHRQEFDVQITDLRARVANVELELQKIKATPH